ncbi:thiamine-phosphate pyrophosphorylase [Brevibacterium sanguinis]|uniref:Thiamine-phosphate synthase n=2 Tax=Brevibacterium TaxID=1696 RepID=A0A366IKB1_9MICO|nr:MULTISPECIES: thiamine phosphate synthase [Brevibacterium]RBP66223.1 thiamine-phosphate pyrophosphorylase [Brevibacterium sanguinis]RBP72874.1 thiamine-phosphate pyrophosphorylase [Brevibacterium celere]
MVTDWKAHTAVRDGFGVADDAVGSELRAERLAQLAAARLYVCTDARREQGDLAEFLDAAYSGGVDIIQLRDKGLEARAEIEALEILSETAHRHGKLFSVNDRADVALLVGADVFHVGQGDLTSAQARAVLGPDVILGRSTHSVEQARAAEADPEIDYWCAGPVWETPTKPGRPAIGLDPLREMAGTAVKPWFAIGGIDAGSRLAEVVRAGASRAVVVRAVTEADDPAAAAAALKAELEFRTEPGTEPEEAR